MTAIQQNHLEACRVIGGITFRPLSAASLALLYMVQSPFFAPEQDVGHEDILVYGWMHAAPIPEVVESCRAGTHKAAALEWGTTAPPCVFETLSRETVLAALEDMENAWTDTTTGFCPIAPGFCSAPAPSHTLKKSGRPGIMSRLRSICRGRTHKPSAGTTTP